MLPSVVEDNASLVNDFRACLVDATCFRLALFSSCSHNYASCQSRKGEGAPQHCATPINKVVKGHLWRHSHSPKGDSASVCRQHKEVEACWIEQSLFHPPLVQNERHLLHDAHLYFSSAETHLRTSKLPSEAKSITFHFFVLFHQMKPLSKSCTETSWASDFWFLPLWSAHCLHCKPVALKH